MIKTIKILKKGDACFLATENGVAEVKAMANTVIEGDMFYSDVSSKSAPDVPIRLHYKANDSRLTRDHEDALDLSIKLAKENADWWRKMYHQKLNTLFDLKGQRVKFYRSKTLNLTNSNVKQAGKC